MDLLRMRAVAGQRATEYDHRITMQWIAVTLAIPGLDTNSCLNRLSAQFSMFYKR